MYKTIIKQIASLQIIAGWVILVPAVIALIYQEWYALAGFLSSGLVIIAISFMVYRTLYNCPEPDNKISLAIVALGWISVIISGAVPLLVIANITPGEVMQDFVPPGMNYGSSLLYFRNPLHALFESTSAFTTTGLTMAVHEPSVGKSILFYRSFANWIGGAGFIIMALAVFKQIPGQGALSLFSSETSGNKVRTNVINTARAIWKAYALVSLYLFIYLVIGTLLILPDYSFAENIFDSLNHTMAGIATGGFSTLDESIAGYHSAGMDYLYIIPMLVGSFSLPFFYRFTILNDFSQIWKDIQTKTILIACLFGSIILTLFLLHHGQSETPVRESIFQFVSALSTTGWQTSNFMQWDDLSLLFIVATAMIVGGAAGGTVGGIKVIRALLLQKGLFWQINKFFFSPNAFQTVRFDNKIMMKEEMNSELSRAGVFVLFYLLFVFCSVMFTVYYMGDGYTLSHAIFESASAQGTVGLSTGITDPAMSPVLESVYIVQMLAGRLEIIPIMVLIRFLLLGSKPIIK